MRKLIVSSLVSLDGVIEAPMTWTGSHFDEECAEYSYQQLVDVEYFLLGRVTYDRFSASWPKVTGSTYMDRINAMKKLVASRTLKEVGWNASLIGRDAAAELATVKKQTGGNIMKYGVTQLDRTLLVNQLVDEYHIWVFPKCVGHGKRAFQDVDPSLVTFELLDTHRFRNGVMILNYRPR